MVIGFLKFCYPFCLRFPESLFIYMINESNLIGCVWYWWWLWLQIIIYRSKEWLNTFNKSFTSPLQIILIIIDHSISNHGNSTRKPIITYNQSSAHNYDHSISFKFFLFITITVYPACKKPNAKSNPCGNWLVNKDILSAVCNMNNSSVPHRNNILKCHEMYQSSK